MAPFVTRWGAQRLLCDVCLRFLNQSLEALLRPVEIVSQLDFQMTEHEAENQVCDSLQTSSLIATVCLPVSKARHPLNYEELVVTISDSYIVEFQSDFTAD